MSAYSKAKASLDKQKKDMEYEKQFWDRQAIREANNEILEYHEAHLNYLENEVKKSGFASDYRLLTMRVLRKTINILKKNETRNT